MLPLLVVLSAAMIALVALPSSANAAFSVSGFTFGNSTLQAAGHPDATVSFNRNGTESEDLRDVALDLPPGVLANPEAVSSKCTDSQFNADGCPSASSVGTMSVIVTAASILDQTVPGEIDVLTPAATDTVTLGMTLRPKRVCILLIFCAQPSKMFLKTGIKIRAYDENAGLRTFTPGAATSSSTSIPLLIFSVGGPSLDITVKKMTMVFKSKAPSGKYFWYQTATCNPAATAKVTLTSYQNVSSSATVSYQPSNCPGVPFNPTTTVSTSNTNSNSPAQMTYSVSVPDADATIQNSLPKIVDIDFPVGSGLDLNALSGVTNCTEDQLRAQACPASSIIGSAYAFSKFLPGPNSTTPGLAGNVYAMGVGNQIPVGVELKGARGTVVIFRGTLGTRGDANAGTGRVYSTFDKIPQLPFSKFSLTISKTVYKNPSTCGTATTTSNLTGFSGALRTTTNTYNVVNCQAAPNTTITNGPPATTRDSTPSFWFTSDNASATFACSVDGGAYAPCTSPFTTEPLVDGAHTFAVKALVGTVEDPTPATYSFTVTTVGVTITPTITPSTTQAVAHPDLTASFDITGGQPKTIALKMPKGFNASLSARPLCSNADAQAGTCGAASQIGTASVTVDTFNGPETGTGNVYLTEGPSGDDAGGVAANIQFSFGNLITQGGAYLVENGQFQYLDLRSIPLEVNGTSINITNLTVNLDGDTGNFLTNPSSCAASAWVSTGDDWAGNNANVFNLPFQATGCNTVPFNPSINQTLSSPVAGTETGVTANLGFGVGNSSAKTIRVNEPPTLGPNFPSFGTSADQCPAAAAPSPTSIYDPTVCPPQSLVGSMTIDTPLLPFDLTGQVRLIEKSPIPWLGVALDSAGIHVRLTGVTSTPQVDPTCDPLTDPNGFCQTQISVLFNNLPDVQMSNIQMVLDGPSRAGVNGPLSGKILQVAGPTDPTCVDTTPASTVFIPYSGTANVTRTQSITISGCQ